MTNLLIIHIFIYELYYILILNNASTNYQLPRCMYQSYSFRLYLAMNYHARTYPKTTLITYETTNPSLTCISILHSLYYCVNVFCYLSYKKSMNMVCSLIWSITMIHMLYDDDLTNRSTIKSRPVAMVIPDILWGTSVSAVVWVIWYMVYVKLA